MQRRQFWSGLVTSILLAIAATGAAQAQAGNYPAKPVTIISDAAAGASPVASPKRLPDFPDVPTVAETLPGFNASGWQVMVAPVGTPAPIIEKISADLTKVITDPEFRKKTAPLGAYPRAMTPAQTAAFVAQEQETWLPIVQRISKKQ